MNATSTVRSGRRRSRWLAILATLVIGLAAVHARPATNVANAMSAADGAELFKTHCASCHGLDGTGNGRLAPFLRHRPSDLTQLSKKNGGMFPTARVRRIAEGRDVESHGDRDMPVWGDAFQKGEDRSAETAGARLDAIVQYLATIQQHQAQ
jgi:mono/diheme cytochrome c family protein